MGEEVLSVSLWCVPLHGEESAGLACAGFQSSSSVGRKSLPGGSKVFRPSLGLEEEGKGDTCIQKFAFVNGRGVGKCLLSSEGQMLIPSPAFR